MNLTLDLPEDWNADRVTAAAKLLVSQGPVYDGAVLFMAIHNAVDATKPKCGQPHPRIPSGKIICELEPNHGQFAHRCAQFSWA